MSLQEQMTFFFEVLCLLHTVYFYMHFLAAQYFDADDWTEKISRKVICEYNEDDASRMSLKGIFCHEH
jgi:hypothetical protein